ncbi:efflux RND transporter periplasmic adaptor subunit [Billgrantia kenyensis]|uniref:Efflux RND transporter periplasmic adaptor subunit n=1 Tax=Billgrantia kenyensis TaxID=321266 RepID=A0A7V9VXK9_9GAMM|nr:efflux RND transporter periplasmic adaptor subunit [Halomonas kenyensis]MBA2777289.1 efflux RND transporter periplasmic adaptor subunit [Halomonas kenyensis]MCG6659959.1 efflux RND transporter periplasmic adaptor subunit [Halomonas kenyensis]
MNGISHVGVLSSLVLLAGLWGGGVLAQENGAAGFGELSCLVEPGRQATLSSQVPGVIEAIQVEPGDRVEPGDTLFTLRRDVELASVALERARADYAERRVQRNQRMIERGMLSESERDEIDTDMRLASMQVNLANARLEQMTHRAPFAGLITQRLAEEGEYIDATPVLELVQLDPLRIEAVMPLTAFGAVAAGDTLEVSLLAPAGREVTAQVQRVDSVIDASSGTFGVGLVLENPEGRIPAGINCRLGVVN